MESLDRSVRMHVFATIAQTAAAPSPAEIAAALNLPQAEVEESLRRLAANRVIVLAPGGTNIWMANPFSAVPTPFRVEAQGKRYFGNCIFDALGVVALLGGDGRVETWCPDCGESLALDVREGRVSPAHSDGGEPVIHFAVPAARWWDNIGYT